LFDLPQGLLGLLLVLLVHLLYLSVLVQLHDLLGHHVQVEQRLGEPSKLILPYFV
jgi:hypothetical protein